MAHTHVYAEHPNKTWGDSVACVACGFRIPKALLPLAIKQGAFVACGYEDGAHCRHPECITYRSTPDHADDEQRNSQGG